MRDLEPLRLQILHLNINQKKGARPEIDKEPGTRT